MNSIKTYVISLSDEKKRRSVLTKRLKEANQPFIFFNAIDGRAVDLKTDPSYSGIKRRLYFGKDLTSPELGILFSNREVLKDIIKNNHQRAIVFEDDVIIENNFQYIVSKLIDSDINWELVRFLGKPKMLSYKQRKIFNLDGESNIVRIGNSPGGSYAYIISLNGAKKLLKSMDTVYLPPDILMGSPWITKIEVLVIMPSIATWDKNFHSSLDTANRYNKKRDLSGLEIFVYPFTRLFFKLKIAFQKRLYFYKHYLRDKRTFNASVKKTNSS